MNNTIFGIHKTEAEANQQAVDTNFVYNTTSCKVDKVPFFENSKDYLDFLDETEENDFSGGAY
jgi:hypothetical protein